MSKNQKRILVLASAFALTFGIVLPNRQCHAHYGRLPSGRILHRMGCPVSTVSNCRIQIKQKNFK